MSDTTDIPTKPQRVFTGRYLGPSKDGRTNRWELTCICGKSHEPTTTMFRRRSEQCPKCKRHEEVDYDSFTP